MSSIVTITLNPAIDKSTTVEAVLPEKKLRCSAPAFEPGGGGVNVARAIKKLGGHATAVYLAGGYTGKFFTKLLDDESVESVVVEIRQHTRENLIVLDTSANRQYRFGMPGPQIQESEWKQLLKTIEAIPPPGYIVASGSLPGGVPAGIFAEIARIAKKKNARCIVDTSGEALKQTLREGVYLLKPNLGELASLQGLDFLEPSRAKEAALALIGQGACEVVVVSMGTAGALLVTREESYMVSPPPVKKISTVGAGDSMVAGMVLSLSRGKSLRETLQYGVACGTAATLNPGTELCRPDDAERLFSAIRQQ